MAKPSVCADLVLQMDWRGLGGDRTHLNRGLYLAIRQAIDSGALLPRSRLPASRDLARELGVSRNTVNHAYEQLQVEGYVRSQVGRGTHVVDTLPAALLLSGGQGVHHIDRKSTRLNSSHPVISYAGFCLEKKKKKYTHT